ncbi:benzoate/H(+) symporter BenE family transporter [Nocardioides daejeonensis]|uniref:benzoate/H(+) symporter BenE family transporter n=1 Tax=Nocardioides daejeonensis TaxID=1046556 RepID=UPI000D74DE48|nr:benzoate/H(+) symporter BenE family transporter [Nocardioides daejeonensis]
MPADYGAPVQSSRSQPVVAGILTALVGFTSSFAVVLAGLTAVGATPAQAASGLAVLCVTQALGMLWLVRRHRIPLTLAWSTPGAALLAGTGVVDGGWPAAVGAFLVVGVLILLTALWPRLGDLIGAIPTPIAQAMLAGVLVPLCLAPVLALVDEPLLVTPVVLTWLVLLRLAPKAAVPTAFVVALAVIAFWAGEHDGIAGGWLPTVEGTVPGLSVGAVLGIALPLYVVTMASQNVPGVAVMASYGYRVPWRETMTVTGLGTLGGAVAGGHAINLAAITAALAANPEADPDPKRRWIASETAAWVYLLLALLSVALTSLATSAPAGLIETVAGLALLGTLGASLAAATSASEGREAAVVTFLVAASGVTVAGIGAAFWGLVAGLITHLVLQRHAAALPQARAPEAD